MCYSIFVTGTSSGLGRKRVRHMLKQHPTSSFYIHSLIDPVEFHQQWEQEFGPHKLQCFQFDIRDTPTIHKTIAKFQQERVTFDRVVANAGVGPDRSGNLPSVELASNTLGINTLGTINFIKEFFPVMSDNARVVIVSSVLGQLIHLPGPLRARLQNPSITQQEIFKIAEEYVQAVKKGDVSQFHWMAYRVAKALLNAWTRFILPGYLKPGQEYIAMHPGKCRTAMGENNAALSASEGADRINECIQMKTVKPGYFYNTKFVDFDTCEP